MKNENKIIEIQEEKVILVEGDDEVNYFTAFLKFLDIKGVQCIPLYGKDSLKDKLTVIVQMPNFGNIKKLGIERDADDNPKGTYDSICDALRVNNLSIPSRCIEVVGNNPEVCVMVIPSQDSKGMLEDLCLKAISSDRAYNCCEEFLACCIGKGMKIDSHTSKVKIQVYLASRPELVNSLGLGAKKHYFPFNHIAFKDVNNFLEKFR